MSKAEKTAEEAKKAVEETEQQNMEIEDIKEVVYEIVTKFNPVHYKNEIKAIANAVLNTTYSYRTIHGISEDTVKDDNKVRGSQSTTRSHRKEKTKRIYFFNDLKLMHFIFSV